MKKSKYVPASVFFFTIFLSTGVFYACRGKEGDNTTSSKPVNTSTPSSTGSVPGANSLNFVAAAQAVTPAVVHIKTVFQGASNDQDPFERLFGPPSEDNVPAMGSGSGVTLSADGYIATNNHVVENASSIEVIFPDRRSFTAELVGRDPSTDLALLKVKATGLPVVKMGNSDNVQVGEWVLAIGYPFSLNTTATAGIVSAKGRSIGIISRSMQRDFEQGTSLQVSTAIESFIQTDAAINPGNSGGALVNTNGELIGINTAIASMTGSYAGYSFAIPVSLASKVLDDLKRFGSVKRGILGVAFPAPSAEDQILRQMGIDPGTIKGVVITDVQKGSAAEAGGLKEGDIIQRINGMEIFSSAEFSERMARHRPGDKVELTYLRDGKERTASVTLKGEDTSRSVADAQALEEVYNKLGATFAPLTPALKQRFNLERGVVVSEVRRGGIFDQIGIPRGTIIGYINGQVVNSPQDVQQALASARNGRVQIMGIAPDGSHIIFNFSLGA